jgi:hypothetical protein
VGASTPLFDNVLQSLQQTVGAQVAAVSAAAPAGSAPAASGTATAAAGTAGSTSTTGTPSATGTMRSENVQAFMHTLFQALNQNGLTAGTSSGGNLVSSLQTLVQQVGSGAAATSATSNLNAAYQNLVNASGSVTAATSAGSAGASSHQSSNTGLQNFLNSLLQNFQSGGVHSLSAIGNSVNTTV